MPGTHYDLRTTWRADAPIADVFELLYRAHDYPRWWRGVVGVEQLELGDPDGVGEVNRMRFRSLLPYTLIFDSRVEEVVAPHRIAGRAISGELLGTGSWNLAEQDGRTEAEFRWQVRTTPTWMRALSAIARPAFIWNHDVLMRRGAAGLARELGVPNVECARGD